MIPRNPLRPGGRPSIQEEARPGTVQDWRDGRIGRLAEQRAMLMCALEATLAEHAKSNDHGAECESCKAGRYVLAEVQRLKQKHG
jgi:hypothetical protein